MNIEQFFNYFLGAAASVSLIFVFLRQIVFIKETSPEIKALQQEAEDTLEEQDLLEDIKQLNDLIEKIK